MLKVQDRSAHIDKAMGEKMSPAFSSSKLKAIVDSLSGKYRYLSKYLGQFADSGEPVDLKDLMLRFSTEISAALVFGIDVDCLNNPNAEIRLIGNSVRNLEKTSLALPHKDK